MRLIAIACLCLVFAAAPCAAADALPRKPASLDKERKVPNAANMRGMMFYEAAEEDAWDMMAEIVPEPAKDAQESVSGDKPAASAAPVSGTGQPDNPQTQGSTP